MQQASLSNNTTQRRTVDCFFHPRGQFGEFCQPGGHISPRFGSKEDTLAHVLAPKRALQHTFWVQRGHFSTNLSPKRTLQHTILLPRGNFSTRFGPEEDTVARVLAPKRALQRTFFNNWATKGGDRPPLLPLCARHCSDPLIKGAGCRIQWIDLDVLAKCRTIEYKSNNDVFISVDSPRNDNNDQAQQYTKNIFTALYQCQTAYSEEDLSYITPYITPSQQPVSHYKNSNFTLHKTVTFICVICHCN